MADLMRIPLDGGGYVTARLGTDPDPDGSATTRTGMVPTARPPGTLPARVIEAEQSLRSALGSVTRASEAILAQLSTVHPSTIEVEFGVELTAEAGAVLAKAGGTCHLTVKLAWEPDQGPGSEPARG